VNLPRRSRRRSFGNVISSANQIPIIDRNGKQKDFPKDYIP
jgi:hypothetical protein